MGWRDRWAPDEVSFGWGTRVSLSLLLLVPVAWIGGGVLAVASAAASQNPRLFSWVPDWLFQLLSAPSGGNVASALFQAVAGVLLLFGGRRWLGDLWRPTHQARLDSREANRIQRQAQDGLTPLDARISNPEQLPPKRW